MQRKLLLRDTRDPLKNPVPALEFKVLLNQEADFQVRRAKSNLGNNESGWVAQLLVFGSFEGDRGRFMKERLILAGKTA
jgi:hypothetical protein